MTKQERQVYMAKYREDNVEKIKKLKRDWYQDNKVAIKASVKEYQKSKKTSDPLFKFKGNIRIMVSNLLKQRGFTKKSNTYNIVGCTFGEFILYIENRFEPWMDWNNYGLYNGEPEHGWDLDHIIPMSLAKTEEEVLKLNNYTNLQPLCSYINRHIKRNN